MSGEADPIRCPSWCTTPADLHDPPVHTRALATCEPLPGRVMGAFLTQVHEDRADDGHIELDGFEGVELDWSSQLRMIAQMLCDAADEAEHHQ